MALNSFVHVVELWPTAEAMALDLGESGTNVRAWKYRNKIPDLYWVRLVGAARRRGYHQVTYEKLARLAATSAGPANKVTNQVA